jgi:hypothetical protein
LLEKSLVNDESISMGLEAVVVVVVAEPPTDEVDEDEFKIELAADDLNRICSMELGSVLVGTPTVFFTP